MKILTETEKQQALAKLNAIDKIIDDCLANDIPSDYLFDEKHELEDAIADYNAEPAPVEDQKDGNQDAPFCGVFLLIKVDKDNIKDAYDHLYRNCPWCGCIRTFEEI